MKRLNLTNLNEMTEEQYESKMNELRSEADTLLEKLSERMDADQLELFDIYRTMDILARQVGMKITDVDTVYTRLERAANYKVKSQAVKQCSSLIYFLGY